MSSFSGERNSANSTMARADTNRAGLVAVASLRAGTLAGRIVLI